MNMISRSNTSTLDGASAQLRSVYDRFTRSVEWAVGVSRTPVARWIEEALASGSVPDAHITWHSARHLGAFFADPMYFNFDDHHYVAYESYQQWRSRGQIEVAEIADGALIPLGVVIGEPHVHYAYPSMVEDGGQLFCVPEVSAPDRIMRVFEVVSPLIWRRVSPPQGVPNLTDPTFIRNGEGLFLVGTENTSDGVILRVFTSPSLFDKWDEVDSRYISANRSGDYRSAGPFIQVGAELFRPTQVGGPVYGSGIHLCRISHLESDQYQEELVTTLYPPQSWAFKDGMHTISGNDEFTLVDAFRYKHGFQLSLKIAAHLTARRREAIWGRH